jgi:serine/threonine-protein kinase
MGSVYEGRHVTLGTPVAIKFIHAEYANSTDAKSRFDTEARAAATIQSRHAIQIFDHGVTDDGRPYIVMELLVGEVLDKRIARCGVIDLAETARIIRQVARALGRAHERGIVHRDLKPENIFLVRGPDDDEDVAKVLDFGIAKIKAAPGAMGISSGTKTGTLLGTPFYMSPEQARGLRTVDQRSDLWSLGVIVFKCVTGKLPFDGESLGDLLVKICTAPVPVPSEAAPGLPAALDAWMARALEREPDHRFQSAAELADALVGAAGLHLPRSVTSTPEPGSYMPSSPYSPRPVSTPEAHGTTAKMPASWPEHLQAIPAATSAPITASAPQPARRPSKARYAWGGLVGLAAGVGGVLFYMSGPRPPHPGAGPVAASSPVSSPSPSTPSTAAAPPPATSEPSPDPKAAASVAPLPPLETAAPAVPTPHAKAAAPTKPKAKPGATPAALGNTLPQAGPASPAVAPSPAKPAANAGEPGY